MRTEEQIRADADRSQETGHTFSNHTEFDIWADRHCYVCVHDDFNEKFCPILSVGMLGEGRPREWLREDVPWTDKDGVTHSYSRIDTCTEFEQRRDGDDGPEDGPVPPPPPEVHRDQLDIVDAYVAMGGLDELVNEARASEPITIQGVLW